MGVTREDVIKLYVAMFYRAPEGSGVDYWYQTAQDNNWGVAELADNMIYAAVQYVQGNPSYESIYPAYANLDLGNLTRESVRAVINEVYKILFNKDYSVDPEGIDYWVSNVVDNGISLGTTIATMLIAAEEYLDSEDPEAKAAAEAFVNKVEVATYFADNVSEFNGDFEAYQQIIADVTDNPDTVEAAKEEIDNTYVPKNVTLITNVDNVTGSIFDDTFTGVISALSSRGTLDTNDKIDGGDGTDTLTLTVEGSFSGFSSNGYLRNVEKVILNNAGEISCTFDATGVSGVKYYIVNSEESTVNLTDLGEIPLAVVLQGVAKDTTIDFDDGVTDRSEDELMVKVQDVGTSSDKVTVTVNGIETLDINAVGTANYVTIADNALKTLEISGSGDLDLDGIGTTVESVDGSGATGNLTLDLTGADTSLSSVKGGAGDDVMSIKIGNILANAEIDGGEGSNVVTFTGGGTVQFTMGNVQTVKFGDLDSAVIFSAKNVSRIENIVATNDVDQDVTFANLGATDITVELQGSNDNGIDLTVDNSGSLTVNVDTPSSAATTTNPDVNNINITAINASSLILNVAEKMKYQGTITANNAESLILSISGALANTISANSAASAIISNVAYDSDLKLTTPNLVELNITANADLDLNDATLGASTLSSLQSLTVNVSGDGNVVTLPGLSAIYSVTLSGSGSVELGNLGSVTLDDYGIIITAADLSGNDTSSSASLEIGNINTKGTDIEIDASEVLGDVKIGNINAANGATTPGDININIDGVGGNVTLGTVKGYDVVIDAEGVLGGTVTYGNITTYHSANITGSNLKSNTITVIPDGSSDVTVEFVGGILDDTLTVQPAAGYTKDVTIDVTGNSEKNNDKLVLDSTNAALDIASLSFSGVEIIDVDDGGTGNAITVNAADITGKTFTLGSAATASAVLTVNGTSSADTIDLSNITPNTTNPDTITVNAGDGADTVTGTSGDDTINGGDEADTITGGAGDDIITGGKGADTLTSGDGEDIFVLDSPFNAVDKITDFTKLTDTLKIDLTTEGKVGGLGIGEFGGDNTVDSVYYTAINKKLKVLNFTAFMTGGKLVTEVIKAIGILPGSTGTALAPTLGLGGKLISFTGGTIKLVTKGGLTKNINQLKTSAGSFTITGILFFYDADDFVIKMYGLKVVNSVLTGTKDANIDKVSVLTSKTIASFTEDHYPIAIDIVIF